MLLLLLDVVVLVVHSSRVELLLLLLPASPRARPGPPGSSRRPAGAATRLLPRHLLSGQQSWAVFGRWQR